MYSVVLQPCCPLSTLCEDSDNGDKIPEGRTSTYIFYISQVVEEEKQLASLQAERRRLQDEIQQLESSKKRLDKKQKEYIKYYGHQSTQTVDRYNTRLI